MLLSFVESFQSNFRYLINNEKRSDVKLLIGKDEVVRYGHSLVLATECPYFDAVLKQPWKDGSDKVLRFPNIEPHAFDFILECLYTGQVSLTPESIHSFVDAAVELQLRHLALGCEEYACQNVGPKTVCDMLSLASRHNLKKLWSVATEFFDINARDLLVMDDWLALDRALLIKVLSRDSIFAPEISVWKAVVQYAYHTNGYDFTECPLFRIPQWPGRLLVRVLAEDSAPQGPSDEEYCFDNDDDDFDNGDDQATCDGESGGEETPVGPQTIDYVVNLPRKQFMDLRDTIEHFLPAIRFTHFRLVSFARYFEGTNLIPVELCRSLYRYHSLPIEFDCELPPPRWFGSSFLPRDQWPTLSSWLMDATPASKCLSRRPILSRLYVASKHGFSAEAFHRRCDNRGATLTIARTSTGTVVGGFNEKAWSSGNVAFSAAEKNFLFLYNPLTRQMLLAKLNEDQKTYAAYNDRSSGPVFGQGYDFVISGDGKNSSMGVNSYDLGSHWLPSKFTVTDYETYRVLRR
ncbi:hypothetical protein DFQ26_002681 [Actinomortierella ambigua]|nr:hypothetical protein DFQ26_002681 [Actinomortierella ambigua]